MNRPSSVKFTGATLTPDDLQAVGNAGMKQLVQPTWTRIHFTIPIHRDAMESVIGWLAENCTGQYMAYNFNNQRNYDEYKIVVRFENPNDAILFKLADGHKAWEHKQQA